MASLANLANEVIRFKITITPKETLIKNYIMKRFIIYIFCLFSILTVNADVLGPYPVKYDQPTPCGYAKVVVYSVPDYSGGGISLTKNGSTIYLYGSVTYMPTWYYFVPSGIYTVNSVSSGYEATVNTQQVYSGSKVDFRSSGYIEFIAL